MEYENENRGTGETSTSDACAAEPCRLDTYIEIPTNQPSGEPTSNEVGQGDNTPNRPSIEGIPIEGIPIEGLTNHEEITQTNCTEGKETDCQTSNELPTVSLPAKAPTYYSVHKERILAQRKEYYKKNRAQCLLRSKKWHVRYKERYMDYNKQYYVANKAEMDARSLVNYHKRKNQSTLPKHDVIVNKPLPLVATCEADWYDKIRKNICRGISTLTLPEAEQERFWAEINSRVRIEYNKDKEHKTEFYTDNEMDKYRGNFFQGEVSYGSDKNY